MKFVLRNANINDIEGLAVAYSNCAHNAYQGILPASILEDITLQKSVKKWRQEFVEQIADADKAIFVIENEARAIVGFSICGAAKSRSLKSLGDGEIFTLHVESDHQGYGLGKALMLANARWLISRGLFCGGAWVLEDNIIGRRFAEDLGGRITTKRKRTQNSNILNYVAIVWNDFSQVAQLEAEVPNWGDFGS